MDKKKNGLGAYFPHEPDVLPGMGTMGLGKQKGRISPNREANFDRDVGRFRNPSTGAFEPGSPPPDLDSRVSRYRAVDGKFKTRSTDLFDEVDEVRRDSLLPEG